MKRIKGEWRWNEVISFPAEGLNESSGHVPGGFSSNGEIYYCIYQINDVHWQGDPRACDCLTYEGSITVCAASQYHDDGSFSWMDDDYRIISFGVFGVDISDELYDFINSNATLIETTVSYKLGVIADNQEKVYMAGKQQGHGEGYDSGYDAGLEAGKKAEYDAFWDGFQHHGGEAHSYQRAFAGYGWNDNTFKPKYNLVFALGYTGNEAFWDNRTTNIAEVLENRGLIIDTTLCGSATSMFQNAQTVRIPELNFAHAMDYNSSGLYMTFINAKVETIDKLIVPENLQYVKAFQGCANLKNIVFDGVIGQDINFQWSTLLTRTSIESIVNHLSDSAEGKTLTLSKAAVDEAFKGGLSAADPSTTTDIGSATVGWFDLTMTKQNWTITLV